MEINGITWDVVDLIDSPRFNWNVWSCIGTDLAGKEYEGQVQGCGENQDWSTLEIF